MANTLRLLNYESINLREATLLNATYDKSATPVNMLVGNSQGYNVGDFIAIGRRGTDSCEIQAITAIPDATHVTVAMLLLPHRRLDRIVGLVGNQIKLYSAPNVDFTTPLDSSFTVVGQPTPIIPDQNFTDVTDGIGGPSTWYKYTYYNSTSGAETSLGAATATITGKQHYVSVDAIRHTAGLDGNDYISDKVIADARDAAEDEVNSTIQGAYVVPLQAPINAIITEITKQIAASIVLSDDTSGNATMSKSSSDRVALARASLMKIAANTIKLTNQVGVDNSKAGPGGTIGTSDTVDAIMTIGKKF